MGAWALAPFALWETSPCVLVYQSQFLMLQPESFHHDQDVTFQFDQISISLMTANHPSMARDHQFQN